jgi:hypothetical protein
MRLPYNDQQCRIRSCILQALRQSRVPGSATAMLDAARSCILEHAQCHCCRPLLQPQHAAATVLQHQATALAPGKAATCFTCGLIQHHSRLPQYCSSTVHSSTGPCHCSGLCHMLHMHSIAPEQPIQLLVYCLLLPHPLKGLVQHCSQAAVQRLKEVPGQLDTTQIQYMLEKLSHDHACSCCCSKLKVFQLQYPCILFRCPRSW